MKTDVIPRIDNPRQLELLCEADPDREFWRAVVWGAAISLTADNWSGRDPDDWKTALRALDRYRVDLRQQIGLDLEAADQVLTDEINLFLSSLFREETMMAKTRTPRGKPQTATTAPEPEDRPEFTGEISPQVQDHCLRMLCCPTAADSQRWRDLARDGMSDEELRGRLMALWSFAVRRQSPPCAASSQMGPPLVWIGQDHTQGTPTWSGDELLDQVRRVLSLPAPKNGHQANGQANGQSVDLSHEGILRWTLRKVKWDGLKSGATDGQVLQAIQDGWKRAAKDKADPGPRQYRCQIGTGEWGTAIWIEDLTGAPRWWSADGHDSLLTTVRDLFRIPFVEDPAEVEAAPQKPARTTKAKAAAGETIDLLAGIVVVEERDIAYDQIQRSRHNPRQAFDGALIQEMAPNIVTICQVTPLTVREGTHELIDGETRHRAAAESRPPLRCKVIRCTDAQAAALRLLSSLRRRDLNPIERAQALRSLAADHGLSQRQLESVVKLKQGSISNLTRLLELPADWQQRVISGKITATDARLLVPWKDEPGVLKELARELRTDEPLTDTLLDAVWTQSRSIGGLKLTDDQRTALRIRNVKRGEWDKAGEDRAFNVELADELKEAAALKRRQREEKQREKTTGSTASNGKAEPSAAQKKEAAKKRAEQQNKRLYRFRVAWYQAMIVAALDQATVEQLTWILMLLSTGEGASSRLQQLQKLIGVKSKLSDYGHINDRSELLRGLFRQNAGNSVDTLTVLVQDQCLRPFEGWRCVLNPPEIETLAELLDIDLARDWTASFTGPCKDLWNDFLALFSKDELIGLMTTEWKSPCTGGSRAEVVAQVPRNKPVPKVLLAAKPVRL